jgi:single-strand DNA-binding protein
VNETYVTIAGNVVETPVRRLTNSGVPFVTFRLASTVRRLDPVANRYVDAGTSFVNVTAFRGLGINVDACVERGQPVIVHGRLKVTQWVSGERSGTSVDIDAHTVGHDLARGQARFARVAKPAYDDGDRLSDPEVQDVREGLEALSCEPISREPAECESLDEDEPDVEPAHRLASA